MWNVDKYDNVVDGHLIDKPFWSSEVDSITFNYPADTPILKISKEGFLFKGELINDAGEAHRAFLKVMSLMKKEQDSA